MKSTMLLFLAALLIVPAALSAGGRESMVAVYQSLAGSKAWTPYMLVSSADGWKAAESTESTDSAKGPGVKTTRWASRVTVDGSGRVLSILEEGPAGDFQWEEFAWVQESGRLAAVSVYGRDADSVFTHFRLLQLREGKWTNLPQDVLQSPSAADFAVDPAVKAATQLPETESWVLPYYRFDTKVGAWKAYPDYFLLESGLSNMRLKNPERYRKSEPLLKELRKWGTNGLTMVWDGKAGVFRKKEN